MSSSIGLVAIVAALAAGRTARGGTAAFAPHAPPRPVAATPVRLQFERGLDSLLLALDRLGTAIATQPGTSARTEFRQARSRFKRIEALLEYYSPAASRTLNGPRPDGDGDLPPPPLGAPAGFGVVEAALFGAGESMAHAREELGVMRAALRDFRGATALLSITPRAALDAARLELARITTLGLAGFDATESGDGLIESAAAIRGTRELLATAGADRALPDAERREIDTTLASAAAALEAEPDFLRSDRMMFLTTFAIPAARAIDHARRTIGTGEAGLRRLWRSEAATVFDRDGFDVMALAPPEAPTLNADLVALGRRLFFDPRLSGPGTRSCASCHVPSRAFTDGRATREPLPGANGLNPRNTPTLLNAALQTALFADQRAASLEDQVAMVLSSPAEMESSAALAAARLRSDLAYRRAFAITIGERGDSTVTGRSVRIALAAYVRSLTALDSRFDRAIRGDDGAMTASERRGFTLFMGKARCATCHFLPLFNGTMPPEFAVSEPEVIGIPATPGTPAIVDADPGREGVDHVAGHRFAFRVPTLRNVAVTGPYMHNGVFTTLEQVIDFYDRGGGRGLGERLPTQTLGARPLHLSMSERGDLIAFLRTLTDTSHVAAP